MSQHTVSGFYTKVALALVGHMKKPGTFLFLLMAVSALLSAVLANDIVCLAFTPVVCLSLLRASLNPVPFLIGLTCAANIGSAATIIGNPQNMLIGQVGALDFGRFLAWCGPPSLVALLAAYWIILVLYRGRWALEKPPAATGAGAEAEAWRSPCASTPAPACPSRRPRASWRSCGRGWSGEDALTPSKPYGI